MPKQPSIAPAFASHSSSGQPLTPEEKKFLEDWLGNTVWEQLIDYSDELPKYAAVLDSIFAKLGLTFPGAASFAESVPADED